MEAVICDRCGAQCEKTKRGQREYSLRRIKNEVVRKQMSRGIELDLCEKCYNNLIAWLCNTDLNLVKVDRDISLDTCFVPDPNLTEKLIEKGLPSYDGERKTTEKAR